MENTIRKIKQLLKLEYPFEVFYEDGSRPWKPEKDKKPWSVFFGNGIISLKEADIMVPLPRQRFFSRMLRIRLQPADLKIFGKALPSGGGVTKAECFYRKTWRQEA